MAEIKLAIEGAGAVAATEDLFQIPGLSGTWGVDEESRKEGTLATIATIVGITVGTMTIAEKLHGWYHKYPTAQPEVRIEKVLIVGSNGKRLLLKDATVKQIHDILEN